MQLHILDHRLWFPPVDEASEEGLLAAGGDLDPERLILAYKSGIFPWFNDEDPPLWWSPDPRFVLFPEKLKISKSMRQVLRSGEFEFRTDTAFGEVIANCMQAPRPGQDGTWISSEIVTAYTQLYRRGYVHCAEAWKGDKLAGGLYGIRMGNLFFGESMFSKESNASKFAFISYVQQLQQEGVVLIDCQVYTEHLERLGAEMIPRKRFMEYLQRL